MTTTTCLMSRMSPCRCRGADFRPPETGPVVWASADEASVPTAAAPAIAAAPPMKPLRDRSDMDVTSRSLTSNRRRTGPANGANQKGQPQSATWRIGHAIVEQASTRQTPAEQVVTVRTSLAAPPPGRPYGLVRVAQVVPG